MNPQRATHPRGPAPGHGRHTRGGFLLPPGIELLPGSAGRRAYRCDRFACSQAPQDLFGCEVHEDFRSSEKTATTASDHFLSALAMNSNKALVAGSSGRPRSALSLLWVVSRPGKSVKGTPASFSALPKRCAWAVVSGCPATYRIRKGGIPLSLATCVTAEKSRCFAGSLPNFTR